ncbi:MAG: MBOAT family O-acyltransferase, partial [Bacteroidales bacterium]
GSTLLLGAFYFTIQIYCDFSGYSDMAIGVAKLLGINLLQNFRMPYFSRNVAEFWRRWHISLNTWFRDYIYIPLGGSHKGVLMTIVNTMIIFLVCGFWHGANWTFILWGAYHGLLFVPLILTGGNKLYKDSIAQGRRFPNVMEIAGIVVTFVLIMFGWILFRADNIYQAFGYMANIFDASLFSAPQYFSKIYMFIIFVMFLVEWLGRGHEFEFYISGVRSKWIRRVVYIVILLLIFIYGKSSENFIYFNF